MLFGIETGGERAGAIVFLSEAARPNGVNPPDRPSDVITRIAVRPINRVDAHLSRKLRYEKAQRRES